MPDFSNGNVTRRVTSRLLGTSKSMGGSCVCSQRAVLALALLAVSFGCDDKRRYVTPAPTPDATEVTAIRVAAGSGGGSTAETLMEPTGWATIRGTIRLVGTPPPNPLYNVTKDNSVCAPGGVSPPSEVYVVGEEGQLADAVIWLKTDLSEGDEELWIHESARPGLTGEVEFDQHACVFDTHVLAMQSSQTLRILNSDSVGHNTKLDSEVSASNVTLPANGSATATFRGQDRKPFKASCAIHPWMYAWIITRENGYFDVTDTTGTFELAHLPAGVPLDIVFWHEAAQFDSSEIRGDGSTAIRRSRISITLDPDTVYEWDISIPAP